MMSRMLKRLASVFGFKTRTCNLHTDCDKADKAVKWRNGFGNHTAEHCYNIDCKFCKATRK